MDNLSSDEMTGLPKLTPEEESWHREQERMSKDTVRVYNPTNKDYRVNWDNNIFVVPALSEKPLIFYVAKKYCQDMKDEMINAQNEEALAQEIISRASKGFAEWTPYEKQAFISKQPRTDNEKLVRDIYAKLWLGIEEEFGLDAEVNFEEEKLATVSVEEKVLASMRRRYVPGNRPEAAKEPSSDSAGMGNKKKIAEEVSE